MEGLIHCCVRVQWVNFLIGGNDQTNDFTAGRLFDQPMQLEINYIYILILTTKKINTTIRLNV